MFDIKEWYKIIASLSTDFEDYYQKSSNGLALLCMDMGKIPEGAGYENFIRAWDEAEHRFN